jgi:hypothetical protein
MSQEYFPSIFLTTDFNVALENVKNYQVSRQNNTLTFSQEDFAIIENYAHTTSMFRTENVQFMISEKLTSFSSTDEAGNRTFIGIIKRPEGMRFVYNNIQTTTTEFMDVINYLRENSPYTIFVDEGPTKLKFTYGVYAVTFTNEGFNFRLFGQDEQGDRYKLKPVKNHYWLVSRTKRRRGTLISKREKKGINYIFGPDGKVTPVMTIFQD